VHQEAVKKEKEDGAEESRRARHTKLEAKNLKVRRRRKGAREEAAIPEMAPLDIDISEKY
jgi:hypothetical protein